MVAGIPPTNLMLLYKCSAPAKLTRVSLGLILISSLQTVLPAQSQEWRKQLRSDGVTLGTVRRIFLDRSVLVGGPVVSGPYENRNGGVLLQWRVASQNGEWYVASDQIFNHLSSTYNSKPAKVIAVQLNELGRGKQTINALGESIGYDTTVNPYFDVIVRFEDGVLAITTAYPNTVGDQVEFASAADSVTEQMSRELPLLIGMRLYAIGYSILYQPDTTLEELAGWRSNLKELSSTNIPRLVPLTIVAAKYLHSGVVFKLRLPNGIEAISFTAQSYYQDAGPTKSFIEKISGTLLTEIPKSLTPKDIDAIKSAEIYKGMYAYPLLLSLGIPDQKDDWERSGKVWVFRGHRLLVYFDHDARVVDWESVDK